MVRVEKRCDCPVECSSPVVRRDERGFFIVCDNCDREYRDICACSEERSQSDGYY